MAGTAITGAKCLMFFECKDSVEQDNLKSGFCLKKLIDKILCSQRTGVTVLKPEYFCYQIRDSQTKFYGTKVGHPILKFIPNGVVESKGRDNNRPALIIARAFKLRKHREWETSCRETTYSFQETSDIFFVAHLRDAHGEKYLHLLIRKSKH